MYAEHFSLSGRPFTNSPDCGYFMPNGEVETAIMRLREVMLARDSMAIVSGGPGVGKSALIAAAHAAIEDRAMLAGVDLRQTDADAMTSLLLLRLGVPAPDDNESIALHQLRRVIAEHNAAGKQVTAVIDLTGMTIERAKRILQHIHLAGEPGGQLNMILTGPHALHKVLNAPGLIHLRQRVVYRYRVRPFMVDEVDDYLSHQLSGAGGEPAALLEPQTGESVFRYVGGVPRLINTLMDAVLSEAANLGANRVGPELLHLVARQLGWKPLSSVAAASKPDTPLTVTSDQHAVPLAADHGLGKPAAAPPILTPEPQLADAPSAAAPAEPVKEPTPVSEKTAMLLLDNPFDDQPAASDDDATSRFPKATDNLGDNPNVMPQMSADDTSATGMLRLEDLDARFAETIFGEDATAAASDAVAARPMIPEKQAG